MIRILSILFILITLSLSALSLSAQAQFTFPINHFSVTADISASLDTIVASCVGDLDTTIAASYTSGQTWSSLIDTDYDLFRGTGSGSDTDDPTFIGVAGTQAAHFLVDGSQFFEIANGNTALLDDMHKTTGSSKVTILFGFSTPATLTPNSFAWSTAVGGDHGMAIFFRNAGTRIAYDHFGTSQNEVNFAADPLITASTDFLFALASDITAGTLTYWMNFTTGVSETPSTQTTTTNPVLNFHLGSLADDTTALPNGYKIRHFSVCADVLDDTEMGNLFSHLETRWGLDVTP